jgi:PAS domain S-box-containing protein
MSGTVLVVAPCAQTEVLLGQLTAEETGFVFERATDPDAAIARVEEGSAVDVVLLAPRLADPVRVTQRLLTLDRDGAVVVLAEPDSIAQLDRAMGVAPFLQGDVTTAVVSDAIALLDQLGAAAARTRDRRDQNAERQERHRTPPPLSAAYLGTLLDSVPIGIVTLDASGAVIGWNKRAGEMLEVSEVEVLGTSFASLFSDDDGLRLADLIDQLGSEGIAGDAQVFHRGGRAFEITGARFRIRSGEPGALVILQDVTKRELAEQELLLQKSLSDAQAETSESGIVVLSLDEQLVRVNKRFEQIWGISEAEMRDPDLDTRNRFKDQVEDPVAFMDALEALAATGEGEFRDEVRMKDGRTIERYAGHAHDADGKIIARIWFHTDVSARKREEEALRFLADATNLLSSSLDYQTTLQRVADLAVPKIADWCTVDMLEDAGSAKAIVIAGTDPDRVEQARRFRHDHPGVESGNVAAVIEAGEPRMLNGLTDQQLDAIAVNEEHRELLRTLALRAVMFVPIKLRDRVYGAISLIRSDIDHPFDDEDLRLAQELARRAGIAIDNARVHAQLRDTARTLQESLLPPHLPAIRGLELAARFRPAGVGMQVGGDFYDIFETGPDQWGIAVGDVCGKGAEAAALTALTRYTVRAAAMYENDAAGVLRVLNEALLRQRGDFRFTTLAYCVVDLGVTPHKLRVASGGHPRPLLLRADGTAQPVGAMGPLLGVVPHAEFSDEELELNDGDALVLYTDGLTDALAPEQMLEEEDVLRTLADCRGAAAGEISARLEHAALAGDPTRMPRDDIALVVARVG